MCLVVQAAAISSVTHPSVEVGLIRLFHLFEIRVTTTSSLISGASLGACDGSYSRLRYIILCKLECLFSCSQLAHRGRFNFPWRWVSLRLQADILSVFSRSLLLLLGLLPVFTTDVRPESTQLCILRLQFHLVEFALLVWPILRIVRYSANAICCGVLTSDLELLLRWLQLVLRAHGDIRDALDLIGKVWQVLVEES